MENPLNKDNLQVEILTSNSRGLIGYEKNVENISDQNVKNKTLPSVHGIYTVKNKKIQLLKLNDIAVLRETENYQVIVKHKENTGNI